MAYHAKLSASGASRWMRCPGSVAAEEGLPDSSSPAALEGTKAHAWGALCLETGKPARDLIGTPVDVDQDEHWVIEDDGEMARYVDEYVRQLHALNGGAHHAQVETAVPISHITGEEGASGTADYIAVEFANGGVTVRVHDLKYGRGVRVEAEDNPQLLMYASGALEQIDWLLDGYPPERVQVEMYIHQVRLDHLPEWRLSLPQLRQWALLLSERAGLTQDPGAPRVPGETQCKFCKARTSCPALLKHVSDTVAEPPPEEVEAVAEFLPRLKLIRDWCATVEARAVELLQGGQEVPGYKLVEGRKTRKWGPSEEEVLELLEGSLLHEDLYKTEMLSPAQIEKLLPKDEWKELQDKLVVFAPGKPTIAPDSDKRPAVNSAESLGFANID